MNLLITGVLLWAVVHLVPSIAPDLKTAWRDKLGEGGYKGTFALLILSGLAFIIMGWRSAQPTLLYLPPEALRLPALGLMVIAFLLFGASGRPTRIGNLVRHPQLLGLGAPPPSTAFSTTSITWPIWWASITSPSAAISPIP